MKTSPRIGLAACLMLAALAASASAQGSPIGEWESTTPGGPGLATLDVQANKWNASVKATAPCGNGTCDWGTAGGKVHYDNVEGTGLFSMITVQFETPHSTTWLLLFAKPQAKLEVQGFTRFKGEDKRFPTYWVQTMKRRPPPPKLAGGAPVVKVTEAATTTGGSFAEACVNLDPDRFEARTVNGKHWLFCGNGALGTFRTIQDAQRAALVCKTMKFDKRCQIGSPKVALYYYTVRGGAPTGTIKGEDCSTFKPAGLKVAPSGGKFAIMEGPRVLLDFPTQSEAKTALAMILHHGFTSLCYVGRPDPGLTYLKK